MQLQYTRDEILADHHYATPHIVGDYHLHGGFDAEGRYLSPRTLYRPEAVSHWRDTLASKGGSALEIGLDLLSGPRFPNYEQHKLMLRHGMGETLWNSFTNVGRTEARGAMIGMLTPPSFERVLLDDVASMTTGHLKPLFEAHGADEGGIPAKGIGGHDQMWFAARDLAHGKERYPLPPVGAGPGMGRNRGEGERWMPDLPAPHAQVMRMLMGLLMIEIRAFILFEQSERLLRDPEIFLDRREQADLAADVVARIRTDEEVHVAYLCTFFGELRSGRIRCEDGSEKEGREVFDPAWQKAVNNSTQVNVRQQREEMRKVVRRRVLAYEGGAKVLEEIESLSDPGAFD
jgi:hypothetical protein